MAEVNLKVRTPAVPRYLTLDLGKDRKGVNLPLAHLTEAELRAVGEAWTAALLAEAAKGKKS